MLNFRDRSFKDNIYCAREVIIDQEESQEVMLNLQILRLVMSLTRTLTMTCEWFYWVSYKEYLTFQVICIF